MAGIGTEFLEGLNTLVFSSPEFLFRYLPAFVLLLFFTKGKARSLALFAGSLLLYAAAQPRYVFLLFGMSLVNYLFGLALEPPGRGEKQAEEKQKRGRKTLLILAVACNLLLLFYFKISNAFDRSFLLPLGISFYTFKGISYLADVYRLEVEAEHSFVQFGAYLTLFPQVVSGPIQRYRQALKGLRDGQCSLLRVEEGLKWLVAGLAAKVLIADRLGILWNDIQTIGFESISTPLAWLGAAAYSLQLYFDFAGYSLMAAGMGVMIGFPIVQNFAWPYASRSVSEFYRRWHITLGSWFKDYVYIPLGGNRGGQAKTVRNLLLVWLLTGLWHGNSVNFLMWGLTLGLLVAAEKLWLGEGLKKHRLLSHLYVLTVLPLTWMVFAISSPAQIGVYFGRLFPFFGETGVVNPGDFLKEGKIFAPTLAAAVLFSIPQVGKWMEKHRKGIPAALVLTAVFWVCVYYMTNAVNNPFLYANF